MRRKRIVFDMCDNHFQTKYEWLHRHMIKISDMVTCPTQAMRDIIITDNFVADLTPEVVVIPDPHEFEMINPSIFFDEEDPLRKTDVGRLFWYGNKTSMPSLLSLADFLSLNYGHSIIRIDGNFYILYPVGPREENCLPYSKETIVSAFSKCDAVIIPQVNDWWGGVKSPNRLLEAVARGRFVLANSIPSYEPFKEWMWIGDIAEGLQWLKQQPGEEICNRIKKAQEYVKEHHDIKVIGTQWERALTSVAETTTGKAM